VTMPKLRRSGTACMAVLALALCCAGCGRKGALEPPPGAAVSGPVPNEGGSTVQDVSGNGSGRPMARAKKVPIRPPKEPFILDPLV
jgi:predicted small lipoprotein YifL